MMQRKSNHAIIVFDSQKSSDYLAMAEQLKTVLEQDGYQVFMGDVSGDKKLVYREVNKDEAAILATFDLEGFEKGTESGSLLYNLLTCKMIHFLMGDKEEYAPYLSNKLSLAMLFYGVGMSEEQVTKMKNKYPNIYYIHPVAEQSLLDMEDVYRDVIKELSLGSH